MNYFVFNGVKSSDMGIKIISKNVYSGPKADVSSISIPGRNGELLNKNNRYGNVSLSYSCYLPAKSIQDLADKTTRIKNWLFQDSGEYHELYDDYDANFVRLASFSNNLDVSDQVRRIGIFTVSFTSLPERYEKDSLNLKEYDSKTAVVLNEYTLEAKPYFKIYGSGDITLIIQSEKENKIWYLKDVDEYIEIDSDEMNCFKDTASKNSTFSGDGFPTLKPGKNTITFEGNVTKFEMIERLVSL